MRRFIFDSALIPRDNCAWWWDSLNKGRFNWEEATTIGGASDHRKTKVCFIPIDANADTIAVRDFGLQAGRMLGIELFEAGPPSVQLAHYEPGHYYKAHEDSEVDRQYEHSATHPNANRKISVACVLGEWPTIQIEEVEMPRIDAGSAFAFPSFLPHRVDTCESERLSLVAWFPGPRWR